ncbi:LGFP repeat-containing protein [Microbacterium sp. AG238]|uniref:LGFP repeat-containing protein n=1 Tax=Microbacterium sp. AG238 TaxID=2183994 RepID=UPI000E76E157|nr:hypothetical protein [Microbacterium sp. AG238]RKE60112.1 LGFP repeat-containing protein [Microbacterium sp. AG238]
MIARSAEPRRRITALHLVFALVAGLLVVVAPAVSPVSAPAASAANAADWDPGYIIDDSVFYSSTGMTASEVQSFLDSRVRNCAAGATCLKNYRQSTDNRPVDRYCDGYQGSPSESAAQIIDKVARSCGINQRVLLVLLEKEQSLVSSTNPPAWAYTAATGQGCPDTAPCDPSTSGFFYQVYYAARQFEIYRLNPNSFGYRAQRWNNILYSPTTSCGTRSVFINNQATAALYIYTPYTPNQAALANLYGTGDACSSYGNRNFWRIFTDWFGDPRSYEPHPGFVAYWNERGGASGSMGKPVSYPVYLEANGQGWYQRFEKGVVYGSYAGGTVFISNAAILAEYERQGGPGAGMSWPNSEMTCDAQSRCMQSFVSASMTQSARAGARVIWGGLNDYWKQNGAVAGALGVATGDVAYRTQGSLPAWVQDFEGGRLVQSPYGIQVVPTGAVLRQWDANGGGENWLGWPTAGYTCEALGCAQPFAGGVISYSSSFGAHVILGGFTAEWQRRGGLSRMGPAYEDLRTSTTGRGWLQNFGAGVLTQGPSGMVLVPYGPEQAVWTAAQSERGWLGWPTGERACVSAGCAQVFSGGAVTHSPTWGTYTTFGSIGGSWSAAGGIGGYGPALNALRYSDANGGGWAQHFGSGVITQRRDRTPVFTPYSPIIDMWYHYGAEVTWLGWPNGAQTCDANGCVQQFQNGVARSDRAGRISFLPR